MSNRRRRRILLDSGGGAPTPVTNNILVTNRTSWNQAVLAVPQNQGYAREHYATPEGSISNLTFTDCGWYIADTFAITNAATGTIRRYVEYPAGVYTPVTWSSAATVSLPAGGQVTSDAVAITIPASAKWWEHIIMVSGATINMAVQDLPANASTIGVTDTTYAWSGSGDPVRPAANASTNHMGAAVINGRVTGTSSASGFCITGDSIAWGQGDITSASVRGDSGYIASGLSLRFANTKLTKPGMTGGQLASIIADSRISNLIAAMGVTDLICEWGGGDLRVGDSVSAIETAYQTIYAKFSGKRIFQTTVLPRSDSTDSYATVANQTAKTDGNWANEITLNTDIRAGLANVTVYMESSDVASSAHNSRVWATPPVPVTDGVHPNSYMARGPLGDFAYRHKYARPAVLPNAVGSLQFTGVGSTTLAFSFTKPSIGTDAITYLVEYKRTIDSSWTQFVTGSSALSGTITGLTANTSYDLRVTPSNDGGAGTFATISTTTFTLFQPLDLGANLGYAWDAGNTSKVTVDGSNNITAMTELYSTNTLGIGGVPAIITNGGQTGNKRVIDFPAGAYFKGNNFQGLLDIPDGSTATSQFTVVEAGKMQASVTNRLSFWGTAGAATLAGVAIRTTTSNRGPSIIEVNSRAAVTAFQSVVETSNYHVFTTIKNGTSIIFRVDGTQVATATLVGDGTWNFNDFYIGTTSGASTPGTPATIFPPDAYSGLVIARTALSGTDLTNIEAWVGATAGL